jgi:shikimate kinase
MKLLLLTGVPGTGKTDLGNYLAEHHAFRHVDFETVALPRFWRQQRR